MKKSEKIKILISCHKPSEYISNEILQPIWCGAENVTKIPEGFCLDNTGENISAQNSKYCELTAQYLAWKNFDLDYYGFYHYRRYLSFSHLKDSYDCYGNIIKPYIYPGTAAELSLDEESILKAIEGYDLILPEKKNLRKMPLRIGRNMREEYVADGQWSLEDIDLLTTVLHELHPEYYEFCDRYFKGYESYFGNMYIMSREIFCEYMPWLFGILEECDKRLDYTMFSIERTRTLARFAERLFNIFLMRLMSQKPIKIKELQTVFFEDTEPILRPEPAFDMNNVAIALSANEYYVPYVATMLESLKDNISEDHNYDILIMTKDIEKHSRARLQKMFAEQKNVSVRFLNVSMYDSLFKNVFLTGHFVLETWFRLLMPEILPHYSKVLYLDSDLLVCDDLAKLYDTDVTGYLLAACLDADTAGLYNGYKPEKRPYMDNVLKIKEPYKYFQAGVILFNLDEFRKSYTTTEMLDFALSGEWELLDQDVLNYLAQGRVKYVDMAWNVMYDWNYVRIRDIISRAPKHLYDMYMEARKNPKIVHYAGPDKPWQDPQCDFAEEFWKYARRSAYYETILKRFTPVVKSDEPKGGKAKIKSFLEKKLDAAFPKYTYRREVLKSLWRLGGE